MASSTLLELPIKKPLTRRGFFIGDNNAMNLELLLSEEYYTETMQTYKLAKAFLEKHPSFQERLFN